MTSIDSRGWADRPLDLVPGPVGAPVAGAVSGAGFGAALRGGPWNGLGAGPVYGAGPWLGPLGVPSSAEELSAGEGGAAAKR